MPPPLTYEGVKQIFEDAHCTLVSKEYISSKKKLEYLCSCGHPDVQQIKIADLKRGGCCPNCRSERLKATNMTRYGYEHNSQRPEIKEAALSGIMKYVADKKHTLEELKERYKNAGCELLETEFINRLTPMRFICVCGKEGQVTFGKFQAGHRCSDPECIMTRKRQTCVDKFGETCYTKTKECQDRRKATCLEKYNVEHPMQNTDVMAKAEKTGHRFKTYTFPSGRQEKVQGYEPWALDHLLKTYIEHDIVLGRKEQPEIWYTDSENVKHRYFSDIYLPKHNLIVEVKSQWTCRKGLQQGKIQLQKQACEDEGFNYLCLVFNENGERFEFESFFNQTNELLSEEEPTNELIYEDETQEEDEDTEEFLECVKPYLQEA